MVKNSANDEWGSDFLCRVLPERKFTPTLHEFHDFSVGGGSVKMMIP